MGCMSLEAKTMTITVEDLITILSQYPPTMKIALTGTEGGFYDASYIDEMQLATNFNPSNVARGPHEDVDYVELLGTEEDLENVIIESYLVIK